MTVLAEPDGFPDVELLARLLMRDVQINNAPVSVVDAPRNPLDPPVVTAIRLPGMGLDRIGLNDRARIEVATFGVSRADSQAMAGQVRELMIGHSGRAVHGVLVDRITEDNGPGQVPYVPDVRRVPTVWVWTVRRHHGETVTA